MEERGREGVRWRAILGAVQRIPFASQKQLNPITPSLACLFRDSENPQCELWKSSGMMWKRADPSSLIISLRGSPTRPPPLYWKSWGEHGKTHPGFSPQNAKMNHLDSLDCRLSQWQWAVFLGMEEARNNDAGNCVVKTKWGWKRWLSGWEQGPELESPTPTWEAVCTRLCTPAVSAPGGRGKIGGFPRSYWSVSLVKKPSFQLYKRSRLKAIIGISLEKNSCHPAPACTPTDVHKWTHKGYREKLRLPPKVM